MNYKYHAADTYMHGWSGKGKLNVPLKYRQVTAIDYVCTTFISMLHFECVSINVFFSELDIYPS